MISRATGEVTFANLRILPQAILGPSDTQRTRSLPVPGWSHHPLGIRRSDRGDFMVEVVTDREHHVQVVLLAHAHAFYRADTPDDSERHVFHEGIIAADLAGQREFSWGQVFCRLDRSTNTDWLILAYTQGPHVPGTSVHVLNHLHTHAPEPNNE